MKNISKLKEKWKVVKEKITQKRSILTYNNIWRLEGKQDEMWDRLRAKLDKAKRKVSKLIDQVIYPPSPSKALQLQPVQTHKMRKSLFMLAASTLMTTAFLTGCDTSDKKVEIVQENVKDSMKSERADEAYLADMENYRNETTQKLEVYTKNILAFKAGIENQKQENKADYQNRITALEQQNSALKMKMDNFQEGGKEKWEAFKTELNQGMNEMDNTLNDSTASKLH